MSAQIILLEDDESLRRVLSRALSGAGYQVRATASPDTALNWVRNGQGELLLADVLLDGTNFLESLGLVRRLRPDLPVIVMSAQATASTAIDAEKGGVFEYLPKPFDLDAMIDTVATALGGSGTVGRAKARIEPTGFIGRSAAIQATFRAIARAATSRAHVMIMGEAGSGKRQAADALMRARNIAVEDAALMTPSHSADEIFASTRQRQQVVWLRLEEWSAEQQKAARDALDAGAGRVIATMSQNDDQPVDVRLVARLCECMIEIPPLRARSEDIAALSEAFLEQFAKRDNQPVISLSPDALRCLETAPWRGNVVELRSVLSRLSLEVRGRAATRKDVTRILSQSTGETSRGDLNSHAEGLAACALNAEDARNKAVDALDRALIAQALGRVGGNRSKAAQLLGLNRNTLARRLSELDDDA